VSAETRRLVDGYFELRGLGLAELGGTAGPIEIYEVVEIGAREREVEALKESVAVKQSAQRSLSAVNKTCGHQAISSRCGTTPMSARVW
jgi:hypothetical protein